MTLAVKSKILSRASRFTQVKLHWQVLAPLFILVSVGLAALLWAMTSQLTNTQERYDTLISRDAQRTVLLSRTKTSLMEAQAYVYRILAEPEAGERSKLTGQFDNALELTIQRVAQAKALSPQLREISELERKLPDVRSRAGEIFATRDVGGFQLAQARRMFDATVADVRLSIRQLLDAATKSWDDASGELATDVQKSITASVLGSILGALVLLGLVGLLIVRVVSRPIGQLTVTMSTLAGGDLQAEVASTDRGDEIGEMARALTVFKENGLRVRALEAQEREASARRLHAAESMASVVSDVGDVVSAAASGDFSARLQIEHADEQMQKLVSGINEINAVVDSATSEFSEALQAIAGGDLTARIETGYRGKFAELKGAINETVERLSATVRTIQVTSADVGLAAREINTGADDLSKRTEEQASSLEETAATTEELAASVKASAQASREAASIADEAMQAAQAGGAIAGEAVEAMARIESASQKISEIIRVIDDIAFQTNLLALNAAVEAARAGDAGKGFAVVASEVRTLAQRSGAAAKDISGLISSSNAEVGEGVKLVRQAGDALTRIQAASQKVAATIADISSASGEQANGIDEMSQAVAHLDEMTQANAALAEQSAASAGSLSDRIRQLNDLVATFRTGQDGTAARGAGATYAVPASEPQRLRQLAEAAFAQAGATAPRHAARKVANGRAISTGWEEF